MSQTRRSREEIRLLLADSTEMACQLLADAIGRGSKIRVVAAVTTPQQAFSAVKNLSPSILLINERLNAEPRGGFQLARELRVIEPGMPIVMLLDSLTSASVVESFRAGATGVFSRDGSLESLRKCIFSVVNGQVWASTEALRFALGALSRTPMPTVDPDKMRRLTAREHEVVELVVDGVKNRDIAQRLGISEHTAKNHLFSIFKKLEVANRVELALAFRQNWASQNEISPRHAEAPVNPLGERESL